MDLFWPESKEELAFLEGFAQEGASSAYYHVGYRALDMNYGVLHSDYSVGVGIPFLTSGSDGTAYINPAPTAGANLMSATECLVYSISDKKLVVEATCGSHFAVCKSKLGILALYNYSEKA